ncbi:MAG: hypothetical protein HRT61_19895, partial [Ekhidna sp.]|nr:hypothetical protein [Ekhidna sp.]
MSYLSIPRSLAFLISFVLIGTVLSQDFSAGINVASPNPNAVLHLVSPGNNQGIMIPKLTTAQRNAMSLDAKDKGLMVFDDDEGRFYFWEGTSWTVINVGTNDGISSVSSDGTLQGDGTPGNELSVNVGTGPDQIAQLDGSGQLPESVETDPSVPDGALFTDSQDLSLTGNELAISNDPNANVDLSPYLDDQVVSLADGGSGNVTIGGTYPNLTIDVPAASDEQDLTLTGNTLAITGDPNTDVDLSGYLDNTDAQDLTLAGNTLSLTGDGTDVDLSAFANTDEQDLTLTGNTLAITGDPNTDVDLSSYLDDQVVSLADGGSGNVTIGGTYPNLTIDVPAASDEQDLTLTGNTLAITGDPNTDVDL